MSQIKDKIPAFLLGMLAGLVLAGSFFILKLDDYFEKFRLYENISKTFYLYAPKQGQVRDYEMQTVLDEKSTPISTSIRKEKTTLKKDKNISPANEKFTELNDDDSLGNIYSTNEPEEEEIIIEKDRMLYALSCQVINLNILSAAEKTADSLLQKVSGVRDDRYAEKQTIVVELWKSPLNYKGYKMSKNKLMLYGLLSIDDVILYKLNDWLYLKIAPNIFYMLEPTYDYKPYQPVNDEGILNKLKFPFKR